VSQQINLFNPIFRKQKKYFSSVTMLQALGIICLGCALLAGDAARRARALKIQAASTDAQLLARQQFLAEARVRFAPRQKSAELAATVGKAQEELALLSNAAATIERGGFGDTRGFSTYFRAFARQRIDGLWLTNLDIGANGSRIGVQGNTLQAELVPLYMRRLASEPVMQGKGFSSLEMGAPLPAVAVPGAAAAPAPVAGAPTYLRFSLQSSGAAAPVSAVAQ
jgi:hypothetical protein